MQNNPVSDKSAFLTVGMHRSGTSALSRSLNLLGAKISQNLIPPNDFNKSGYWESQPIVEYNDRLLKKYQRHWSDPKPMPQFWQDANSFGVDVVEATELLQKEFNAPCRLVIKDPRLSRLLPVWHKALTNFGSPPVCIIACRNPLEVHRSLQTRNKMSHEHAYHLWFTYMLEAEYHSRGLPRAIVHYDALLENWRETLQQALQDSGAFGGFDLSQGGDEIDGFINTGQRHHASQTQDLAQDPDVDAKVKELYRLFRTEDLDGNSDHFDHLAQQSHAEWAHKSPGSAGSSYPAKIAIWHFEQSHLLTKNGEKQAALEAARKATELDPDKSAFWYLFGKNLLEQGHLEPAENAFQNAIRLQSQAIHPRLALARTLIKSGQRTAAIITLKAALQVDPQNVQCARMLGFQCQATGDFAEAENAFKIVLSHHPDAPLVTKALVDVLNGQGKKSEAIEALNQALKRAPNNPNLHYALGRILTLKGDFDAAKPAFREAQKFDGLFLSKGASITDTAELAVLAIDRLCSNTALGALGVQQCLRITARPGAAWWANDVINILEIPQQPSVPEDERWPLGRKRAEHAHVPVAPRVKTGAMPQLSIMIPVYEVGQEKWLRECIESILVQDRGEDWAEIIVVDDGSKNPLGKDIAQSYGPRVRYHCNSPNLGLLPNHNNCLNIARGEFIHFVHQDDRIEPGFYDAVLAPMVARADIVASYSSWRYIDQDGNYSGLWPIENTKAGVHTNLLQRLGFTTCMMFPSIIVRRTSYEKLGGFSPSFGFLFDTDMWARLAALGPVWNEPKPLACYRSHNGSATHTFSILEQLIDRMRVRERMLVNLPHAVRYDTARTAFDILLQICWRSLLAGGPNESDEDLKKTVDFLTRNWATPDQKQRIIAALKQTKP